ncbi:MAG: hypothetical protein M3R38_14170 [Actinomycetota bacterium]|nr:hypothetical protein [Actinomycetota bacterium]
MTDQAMRELLEDEGLPEEVARLRLQDRDLWLLHPGARFDEDLQGEQGVRLWEEAAAVARTVAESISNGPGTIQANAAITMLAWDAAARAEKALARARERVSGAEDIHITPTIIYRLDRGVIAAAVVEHEDGRALCVFRSEEEAERYRTSTGKYPESEGFKVVCANHEALKTLLELHGCTHVAMPEPWTGEGEVDFFKAADFIGMLEESVPA